MGKYDKFIKSYIAGLKLISQCDSRYLTEPQTFSYKYKGKNISETLCNCVVPDCDDKLMGNWLLMQKWLNDLYKVDKNIGVELEIALNKL